MFLVYINKLILPQINSKQMPEQINIRLPGDSVRLSGLDDPASSVGVRRGIELSERELRRHREFLEIYTHPEDYLWR